MFKKGKVSMGLVALIAFVVFLIVFSMVTFVPVTKESTIISVGNGCVIVEGDYNSLDVVKTDEIFEVGERVKVTILAHKVTQVRKIEG